MFETLRNDPRRRNLAILAAIAVVTSLLALITLVEQARETAPHYREETFFPGLASHAGNVAHIKIVSKNGDIDLALKGEGWVIANHDNYPASFDEVHQTVVGMAALLTLQPATSRADWLHYVGLDTPPHGDGVLIALRDQSGNDLASVILGKTQDIGDPSGAIGLFVRKPGDTQTWLARSPYEFKSDLGDWFDKTVMNVDRARIQETDVDPASGTSFTVRRDTAQSDFKLNDVPKGREVADGATDGIAAAITGFTFDDVKPSKNFDFSDAGHPTRVTTKTFDGLTVTVEAIQQGGATWATVSAEGAPGKSDAQKEARDIDLHAFGWAYKLAAYKGQQFMTSEDSLLKPVGGAAPAQPAPQQICLLNERHACRDAGRRRRAYLFARPLVHGRPVEHRRQRRDAPADAAGRTGFDRAHARWARLRAARYLSASRRAAVGRPRAPRKHRRVSVSRLALQSRWRLLGDPFTG